MLDGQPQSHVDLADPGLITFEYVQHFCLAIASCSPAAPAPLRVTHVGGAGLTLARWVQHTRPGSPQIVLEPDSALSAAVRERLPLPRGHRIRVRPVDGRTGVGALGSASADVIVLDAYAAGRVPAELVTPAFLTDVARVLAPGGLLLANLADEPGLRWAARVLATMAAVDGVGGGGLGGLDEVGGLGGLGGLAILSTHDVLKGRRFGNVVAVASRVVGGRTPPGRSSTPPPGLDPDPRLMIPPDSTSAPCSEPPPAHRSRPAFERDLTWPGCWPAPALSPTRTPSPHRRRPNPAPGESADPAFPPPHSRAEVPIPRTSPHPAPTPIPRPQRPRPHRSRAHTDRAR
jgi:hypothetical protein